MPKYVATAAAEGTHRTTSRRLAGRAAVLALLLLAAGCTDESSTTSSGDGPLLSFRRRPIKRTATAVVPPTTPVDTTTPAPTPTPVPPVVVVPPVTGGVGCGLTAAAFCDTFDAIAAVRGRAGDLDVSRWSTSRTNAAGPSSNGAAFASGPATIGTCRANLPAQVYPPNDLSVCDANTSIKSAHLAVAVGAQNYGQTSNRIRQPFSFTGRTGKIVFDAEGFFTSGLHGWFSVAITQDPAPSPSFVYTAINDEGGAIPRNAVEVHFQRACAAGTVGVRFVGVIREYAMTTSDASSSPCVTGVEGKLNRFVIEISRTHIVVRGTNASADGVTFGAYQTLYEGDISLPFDVGYVQLSTHNHATRKYTPGWGSATYRDAWVTRWDNVGFDGPVLNTTREYEIDDSRFTSSDASNQPGPVMNVGYRVADEASGAKNVLTFRNVNTAGMTTARLAVAAWYLTLESWYTTPMASASLRYRFNGGTWRERRFTAAELTILRSATAQGQLSQIIDVPITDLVAGNNTVEFTTHGVPQQYPPLVSAIDLILAP